MQYNTVTEAWVVVFEDNDKIAGPFLTEGLAEDWSMENDGWDVVKLTNPNDSHYILRRFHER